LLGDGEESKENVANEEKKCFVLDRLDQPRHEKNRQGEPNEPSKEEPMSNE
jgi:hypothetical protein